MFLITQTDEALRTPDPTNCEDPLHPIQIYKAYYRVQQQRYKEGPRLILPTLHGKN